MLRGKKRRRQVRAEGRRRRGERERGQRANGGRVRTQLRFSPYYIACWSSFRILHKLIKPIPEQSTRERFAFDSMTLVFVCTPYIQRLSSSSRRRKIAGIFCS